MRSLLLYRGEASADFTQLPFELEAFALCRKGLFAALGNFGAQRFNLAADSLLLVLRAFKLVCEMIHLFFCFLIGDWRGTRKAFDK